MDERNTPIVSGRITGKLWSETTLWVVLLIVGFVLGIAAFQMIHTCGIEIIKIQVPVQEKSIIPVPSVPSVPEAKGPCDAEIVLAVFMAEGNWDARYLCGVKSVQYSNSAKAFQTCLNSIRNQRARHKKHKCGLDLLSCWKQRFCPGNEGNNKHWLKNVEFFLAAQRRQNGKRCNRGDHLQTM